MKNTFQHIKVSWRRRRSMLLGGWIFLLVSCIGVSATPIAERMVDLTYVFDKTTLHFPKVKAFETETVINGTLDTGNWMFYEDIATGTHAGTHMDAPAHSVRDGRTVDQIPLNRLFGPAAVIDIEDRAARDPDAGILVQDLLDWERDAGRTLDGHIVLMKSGWGRRWDDRTDFLGTAEDEATRMHAPGMSPAAARWLVDNRDVFGFGVDSISLDQGTGSRDDFPTHRILLGAGLYGLENVANVDKIPVSGARLTVMPMKVGGGSGAPVRIVATFTDVEEEVLHGEDGDYSMVVNNDVNEMKFLKN